MRKRTWMLALLAAITFSSTPPVQARSPEPSSKVRPAKVAAAKKPAQSARPAASPQRKAAAQRKAKPPQKAARSAQRTTQARAAAPSKAAPTKSVRRDRKAQPAARLAGKSSSQARHAVARSGPAKAQAVRVSAPARTVVPARMSIGHAIGLHVTDDPLDLRSSVALVVDQRTGETLFSKNAQAVLPIASITKLMTALVVIDSGAPLGEMLSIGTEDIDTEKNSGSRLPPGTRLSRGEMLQLALMSSENRAANAMGRHHPGGLRAFVAAMNIKAAELGMMDSRFVEPTGLSSRNVSSARDLSRLVRASLDYPLVREFSTATGLTVDTGYRAVSYRHTNRLISSPTWDIGLQKTGYISEAGNCLVMQASVDGRDVVMVLLDAQGSSSRFADAQRLRQWLEQGGSKVAPMRTVSAPSFGS